MAISYDDLYTALEQHFPDSTVEVEDLRGDDDHYAATIISADFAGKSRIEQHRMVQNAVAAFDIHALAIKTQIT